MFTGIITELGTVQAVGRMAGAIRLRIGAPSLASEAPSQTVKVGDSIAVNGVCLTVVEKDAQGFAFDCLETSLSKTGLGSLKAGDRVNLEPSLSAQGRFDGHIVQGHVNGQGRIVALSEQGDNHYAQISLPPDLLALCVREGSIAVNGVSLTIAGMSEAGIEISIIPHTWTHTTFQYLEEGDAVNIETDIFARYIERLFKREIQMKILEGEQK